MQDDVVSGVGIGVVSEEPNIVYNKMAECVPILPEDTNKWSFCLPGMYYHVFTP